MIHLITAANRHLYFAELQAVHAARRNCFIGERGWELADVAGGEYDAYDDDLAAHLIGFTDDHEVAVSCRIRPTLTGGVIPDHFSHLIADSEPSARQAGVYESTRYFCTPRLRGQAGFDLRSRLHVAMVEHVRDRGGHRLLGFVDLPLLTHLRRFSGLTLRPVGLPAPYGGDEPAIAFEIGVGCDHLVDTRARLRLPGRQLFEAPAWVPQHVDPHSWADALEVLIRGRALDVQALAQRVRDQDVPRPVGLDDRSIA